jgi:hypothetical protein
MAVENILLAVSFLVIMIWLPTQAFSSFFMTIAPFVAILCNFFQQSESAPMENLYNLITKVFIIIRFLICFCVIVKMEGLTTWDWKTAFWPFWCSLAIQAIVGVALFIFFMQTCCTWNGRLNEFMIDCSSCLWTTSIFCLYSFCSLQSILTVMAVFDN